MRLFVLRVVNKTLKFRLTFLILSTINFPLTATRRESGPPQKVDQFFFETCPVGANQSIEFWTEISGHFGRMDRAL